VKRGMAYRYGYGRRPIMNRRARYNPDDKRRSLKLVEKNMGKKIRRQERLRERGRPYYPYRISAYDNERWQARKGLETMDRWEREDRQVIDFLDA